MNRSYYRVFEKWEIAIVKKLVYEFRKSWKCLQGEEFDDLLQECFIHWIFVKKELNRQDIIYKKSFMAKIIRSKLRDHVRSLNRQKTKANYRTVSISSMQNDSESSINIMKVLSVKEEDGLAFDLKVSLLKLSMRQKQICRLLEADFDIAKIARYLNVSRDTIYSEIEKIRRVFKKGKLDSYLKDH